MCVPCIGYSTSDPYQISINLNQQKFIESSQHCLNQLQNYRNKGGWNALEVTLLCLWNNIYNNNKNRYIVQVMSKLNLNLPKLRQSQRILSKQPLKRRPFKFCCCDEQQLQAQSHIFPNYQSPPPNKISIKIMRKRSQLAINHSNSQISISKNSNRSIVASKRGMVGKGNSFGVPTSENHYGSHTTIGPKQSNITFLYSNRNTHSNNPQYYQHCTSQPSKHQHVQPMYAKPKVSQRITPPSVPLNQSIENQFKSILDIGDGLKQQYSYGEPFPLNNPQTTKVKSNSIPSMPNFSFGQNQKDHFMSKYLNVKQVGKQKGVDLIEEQSRSSKSSGQVFIRGTFNKNPVNGVRRRELLYEYKSESDISVESSQSVVVETFQTILERRESFIQQY